MIVIQRMEEIYVKYVIDNNVPIYIQLVDKLKKDIISGKVKPGQRLLSVRELALQNKVNPNTMQKVLGELENENLIYTESTNGKYVTTDEKIINRFREKEVLLLTGRYVDNMVNLGITKEEIIKKIEDYKGGI